MSSRDREASTKAAPNSSALVNIGEIEELIDLIIEKGISEFELERSGVRIKIARNTVYAAAGTMVQASIAPGTGVGTPQSVPVPASAAAAAVPDKPAQTPAASVGDVYAVRSPIVGTFYASATPGGELFVRVGDKVQAGQVLCIIEAMKLMNEIEAEVAGEVIKCYVENGQPVEYGEPLFDLRPSTPVKRSS